VERKNLNEGFSSLIGKEFQKYDAAYKKIKNKETQSKLKVIAPCSYFCAYKNFKGLDCLISDDHNCFTIALFVPLTLFY
jgi:hypothetical protein